MAIWDIQLVYLDDLESSKALLLLVLSLQVVGRKDKGHTLPLSEYVSASPDRLRYPPAPDRHFHMQYSQPLPSRLNGTRNRSKGL